MDITVITTYRCNSRCSTCNIWMHPTRPADEIGVDIMAKLPNGIDNLNITGGEPTIRADLAEIVDVLYPKARKLEISSNGLHPQRLEALIKKYPDIKIRFSLEGTAPVNDRIRGEVNGYQIKVDGLRRLKELGGCDLGFAATIQDDNMADLPYLYDLTQKMGVELATSSLHNGFQFHKNDNYLYDRTRVAHSIEFLIKALLNTNSIKNWFRAYLNLGLMEKAIGNDRLIPCTAASDFAFVDPWCDVYACNVRNDLRIGNLKTHSWEEIFQGERAAQVRKMVNACTQNCWMVGSARTAMRNRHFTNLPKIGPLMWVISNKLRVAFGLRIPFEQYVNFHSSETCPIGAKRQDYLNTSSSTRRQLHTEQGGHYDAFGEFHNR